MQRTVVLALFVIARATVVSGSAPSSTEARTRAAAIRLYQQQPMVPVTSMDGEFGRTSSSPSSQKPSSGGLSSKIDPSPVLQFSKTWYVLDAVAKTRRDLGYDEGAIIAAVAQRLGRAPMLCIHGFSLGHAAIAWLEANSAATVALLHPLAHLSETSSHAFVKTLYPGRVLLFDQALPLLRRAGCQAVHVNLGFRDQEVVELFQAVLPSIVTHQHVLIVGGEAESADHIWSLVKSQGNVKEALGIKNNADNTCKSSDQSCNAKCQFSDAPPIRQSPPSRRHYYVGHFIRSSHS